MDLVLTNTQLFTSQDIELEMCGLVVNYSDVFIIYFGSHFDGNHSLQRIHQLYNAQILQIYSNEETNSSTLKKMFNWIY